MLAFENQTFAGTTVILDDKIFIKCKIDRCTVIYAGGDLMLDGTKITNSWFKFDGPAARTIKLLKWLKALPEDALPQVAPPPPDMIQ